MRKVASSASSHSDCLTEHNDRNDDLEPSLEALAEKATLDLALAIFQFHAIDRVIQIGKFPLFDVGPRNARAIFRTEPNICFSLSTYAAPQQYRGQNVFPPMQTWCACPALPACRKNCRRSVVEALDGRDAIQVLQLRQQLVELAKIPDLDIKNDLGEVGGNPSHVEVADIDIEPGNGLCDRG